MENNLILYNATAYYRLSKDDYGMDKIENKNVSNSIINQQSLVRNFLKSHPEIKLCQERIDDGYTGANFERPGFKMMMEDIKAGRINCVIVKDLSRFGRDYLETGNYIKNIFPKLNVRFIAINDNYDSIDKDNFNSEFLLPIRTMFNEWYIKDGSERIRRVFETKRNIGEFIGNFAVYGYKKDPKNKNKLIIDEYAAEVVKKIYQWKLEGLSQLRIAQRLNESGELSPMEYKKVTGLNFQSSFKKYDKAKWSSRAVSRILKNEIYIGVLSQGKRSTQNYKVKNTECKNLVRVENTHEPIISKEIFDLTQVLLSKDLRVSQNKESSYLFSGLLVCGDCEENLIRKTTTSNGKEYAYYVCSTHRLFGKCSNHNISEKLLYELVLNFLNQHIRIIIEIRDLYSKIQFSKKYKKQIFATNERLTKLNEELEKNRRLKLSVYEDYANDIIGYVEYTEYNKIFTNRIEEFQKNIEVTKKELEVLMSGKGLEWSEKFIANQNIEILDRKILIMLIEKITIYEDKKVIIKPKYSNEFSNVCDLIKWNMDENKDEVK